jgi:hypothetical protein
VLSSPAARVSVPAEQTVLIQLTDRAEALTEDDAAFDAARAVAKRHLGEDAFWAAARLSSRRTRRSLTRVTPRTAADLIRQLTEYAVESLPR